MKRILLLPLICFSVLLNAQNFTLTSVVVNSLNDSWCGDVEETNWPFIGCTASPDPYATLTDGNGNTVFQSASNVDNFSLELSLNIALTDFPYTLTIWDEDGVVAGIGSNDDNLGNFTLDGSQTGTFTLSNSGTTITVTVMASYMGCTDVNASNYDPVATMNDGSCIYEECSENENLIAIEVQTDAWGYETAIQLTGFNGQLYLDVSDFSDNTLSNFNVCVPNSGVYSFTITDEYGDGICCDYGEGYYTITSCGEVVASGGSFGESETITIESCDYQNEDLLGCTDINAFNYNSLANVDNGSCLYFDCPNGFTPDAENLFYPPEGSTVLDNNIQLPTGTINQIYEEYIQFYAPGQLELDGTSIEFNSVVINSINNLPNGLSYQCSSGNCSFSADQIGCIGLIGTPQETGVFDLSIQASVSVSYDTGILGTVDINFDIPYYGGNTYLDLAGVDANTINSIVPNITLIIQEEASVFGCTDPLANNYDPLANQEDNSCDYTEICDGYTSFIELQTASFAYEISWELLNDIGDTLLNSDEPYENNSTYTYELCISQDQTFYLNAFDSYGDGWSGTVIDISIPCNNGLFSILNESPDDGILSQYSFFTSCTPVSGCTDESASNYNELANIDDGICAYPVYGCTDPLAVNYDDLAEVDDNSCSYFNCDELEVAEAGFFPPEGSSYNEDSTIVYLPDAQINEFYDQNLQFFAEDTITIEGLEIGFISAKILEVNNLPVGMYYQTSSADSTFYPNNTGCVGLFGNPVEVGISNLSIEATVTVEILGSPLSFDLPYQGGVVLLDLVFADGDYSSLNNFIPTFVIEVTEEIDPSNDVYGCTDIDASNYNSEATVDDATCIFSQTLNITTGWSLISTYIQPENLDITLVLSPLENTIVIIKNNAGDAFLPEWNFNGIGDMIAGQGYQVKLSQGAELLIVGDKLFPELTPIELIEGWNLIAYLRENPANVVSVFQTMLDNENLVIVKDTYGNAYLPEWDFNGIGDMIAGQGYQLKTNTESTLIYLPNNEEY